VYLSPTGASRLFHPEGELAVARAAARAGTLYGLSANSTRSLEQVAAASVGPKLFQIFVFKDRDFTAALIRRCREAGYSALCLTVDTPTRGNCEREARSGIGVRTSISSLLSFAMRPRWLLGQIRERTLTVPAIAQHTGVADFRANSRYIGAQLDASITWEDVRRIADEWGGPLAIKGIMSARDAALAADAGASAVIVSNHGGRQLDGAAAAVEALPDIVQAVGQRVEVILDGGIRRGVHVLKALALGAKACSVGRAYLFGLAAGGEAGVLKALQILRSELIRAMQLSGCNDTTSIPSTLVRRYPELRA
jgi:L-lactate dehydrogenase (cytochrome)